MKRLLKDERGEAGLGAVLAFVVGVLVVLAVIIALVVWWKDNAGTNVSHGASSTVVAHSETVYLPLEVL